MLLLHQFRHRHNKKHDIGHRSKPLIISSHTHHPYFINSFFIVSASEPTKWIRLQTTGVHTHCSQGDLVFR